MLTESWHGSSDNIVLRLAMPPGYCYVDLIRPHDPYHGGIVIYLRSYYKYSLIELPLSKTIEAVAIRLSFNSVHFILLALYRPGSASVSSLFFKEFTIILEHLSSLDSMLLIVGDFNVHVERVNDCHAISLSEVFSDFQLRNWINEPTHTSGGTLDLVVSSNDFAVSKWSVFPAGVISDHSFIFTELSFRKTNPVRKTKLVRSWSRINHSDLVSLINKSPISKPFNFDDVDYGAAFFNTELKNIIDIVAPLHVVSSRCDANAPWFDTECRALKRICRKTERNYKLNPCSDTKSAWKIALENKSKMFSQKKNDYWTNLVQSNRNQPKKLWSAFDKILCRESAHNSPNVSLTHTPDKFAEFFTQKILLIRSQTGSSDSAHNSQSCSGVANAFSSFSMCSLLDVKNFILNSPTKSCSLDCLPTNLFKQYIDLFLPYLVGLINLCLSKGHFPQSYKHAIITPKLKKITCDKGDIKNYRPVSNLCFISKVIERVVAKQLIHHLESNCLLPANQSGYRQYHSTETALLQVCMELFANMDAQHVSLLGLLDLSGAFDCVDHEILLERLGSNFGISETVALWFRNYLSGRTSQVLYGNQLSDTDNVLFGVPQGSVLGPILFLLYTADVFKIIHQYGFKAHMYADDIQIIVSGPALSFQTMAEKFLNCLNEIDSWMSHYRLKLNQSKTQFLPVGTWQQLSKLDFNAIKRSFVDIEFNSAVLNLGFYFDRDLSMHEHIRYLTGSCGQQLRSLRLVRKSLNQDATKSLIHAFIHSRIDYCNSLYYGLSEKLLSKLQSIQNRAARIVVQSSKYDHISPVLNKLHWLPINKRIVFKIGVLMFKCLNNLAPSYLIDELTNVNVIRPKYQLRSKELNLLVVPPTQLVVGSRNFAVFGPIVWNSLPISLREPGLSIESFRKHYKAYLFSR